MKFITRWNSAPEGRGYLNDPSSPLNGQVISIYDVDVGYYFIDHTRGLDGLVPYDCDFDFDDDGEQITTIKRNSSVPEVKQWVFKRYMETPFDANEKWRPYEDFLYSQVHREKCEEFTAKFCSGIPYHFDDLDSFLTEKQIESLYCDLCDGEKDELTQCEWIPLQNNPSKVPWVCDECIDEINGNEKGTNARRFA